MWITGSQILLVGLLHRTLPLDSSLQFTPQHSIQSHTKSRKVTPIPFDLHASVCLCTMVQCFFFHIHIQWWYIDYSIYAICLYLYINHQLTKFFSYSLIPPSHPVPFRLQKNKKYIQMFFYKLNNNHTLANLKNYKKG